MSAPVSHLLVIGEREALAWILREERMAFPAARAASAGRLQPGATLLMLTTRGCYHNPTRDRTLVIGESTVTSAPVLLEKPIRIARREFVMGCSLRIEKLAPIRHGVEVAPLVASLEVFRNKRAWSATLRQTLVALGASDTGLLRAELESSVRPTPEARSTYLDSIRPVRALRTAEQ